MKRYLILFALFPLLAFSQVTVTNFTVGRVTRVAASSPYLFRETFEGTGYATTNCSETLDGGTINEDASTSGLSMVGSQCGQVTSTGGTTYITARFPTANELWGYFKVRVVSGSSGSSFVSIGDLQIYIDLGSGWYMRHGTVSSSEAGTSASGTTYTVWWHRIKSTGSDGVAAIWVSSDGTKPGSPTVSMSNGDGTGDATDSNYIARANVDVVYDEIIVSTTEVPETP